MIKYFCLFIFISLGASGCSLFNSPGIAPLPMLAAPASKGNGGILTTVSIASNDRNYASNYFVSLAAGGYLAVTNHVFVEGAGGAYVTHPGDGSSGVAYIKDGIGYYIPFKKITLLGSFGGAGRTTWLNLYNGTSHTYCIDFYQQIGARFTIDNSDFIQLFAGLYVYENLNTITKIKVSYIPNDPTDPTLPPYIQNLKSRNKDVPIYPFVGINIGKPDKINGYLQINYFRNFSYSPLRPEGTTDPKISLGLRIPFQIKL
jgi:hypothetical protein